MQARMLIGGQWVEGGNCFAAVAPSTGERLGFVCRAGEGEVDAAVAAARGALPAWSGLAVEARAGVLSRVRDLLVARYGRPGEATEIKNLLATEVGKPLPEADLEVSECADVIAYFVKEAPRLLAPAYPELNRELWPTRRSCIVHEPVGVVGVIKPWNYPLELPLWAIVPALVAGNTVVFKPSEYSSFIGLEIGRLFEEAGLPPGALNIVTGDGEAGKALVRHRGVDMISFTGSVPAGREIAVECGRQLKKCSLELGGNDPAIVEPDVDLELAAGGLVWGAFCNAGQVCVSTKRAYVHQKIADELTRRVVEKTKTLRPAVDFGPIISAEQLARIQEQVDDAASKGATILVGGRRVEHTRGYYYAPTVLVDVNPSMSLMSEECFGPVLPIITVSDTREAVARANESDYGLGASVWTADLGKGEEIAKSIQSGMVWVNDVNVAFPETPWGGVKCSGIGCELSEWGLYEYVQRKHINVEQSADKRRSWWYPYPAPSTE